MVLGEHPSVGPWVEFEVGQHSSFDYAPAPQEICNRVAFGLFFTAFCNYPEAPM